MNGGGFGVLGEVPGTWLPGGLSGPIQPFEIGFELPVFGIPQIGIFAGGEVQVPTIEELLGMGWPEWSVEPILETRPGEIPDPLPGSEAAGTVNPEAIIGSYQGPDTTEQEDDVVAHDWGHLLRQGVTALTGIGAPTAFAPAADFNLPPTMPGGVMNPVTAGGVPPGGGCDGAVWAGGAPPKGYKVVNSCGVGVLRKVRRRRRKRMLTVSDKNDIASIISMVGKGNLAATLMNRGG